MTTELATRWMASDEVIAALALPDTAIVDQRVSKKLLLEKAAATAADKRAINDFVSEVRWVAALKPNTIGVPAYRDDLREYLEIAALCIALREAPNSPRGARIAELVHRAIPYPVFLILTGPMQPRACESGSEAPAAPLVLSLAHIRWAQNDTQRVVIDGVPESIELSMADSQGPRDASHGKFVDPSSPFLADFCRQLAISALPRTNMFALYQGWLNAFVALQAAAVTGRFVTDGSGEAGEARRHTLRALRDINAQIAAITSIAAKERQLPRRVELNLQIQALRLRRRAAVATLAEQT